LPGSWTAADHPTGAIYFYDKIRVSLRSSALIVASKPAPLLFQRIFTDTNLYDKVEHQELESFATYMLARWPHHNTESEMADYDLVLEIRDDDNDLAPHHKMWCYYFVNHTTKVIFWLDKYDAHQMINMVNGITPMTDKSCISESVWTLYHCSVIKALQNILWNQSIGKDFMPNYSYLSGHLL
jgi:hypothetical protein